MASFLQNHGDIILDAVLTDYGRKLLARGDGSFKVVKFALADDEIDYGLFDVTASTINKDIQIMNTPILEAFTNNAASMKSKLMSMGPGVDNLLFLPIMKLYKTNEGATGTFGTVGNPVYTDGHVVPVDIMNVTNMRITSEGLTGSVKNEYLPGVLNVSSRNIIIDQGLDSSDTNSNQNLKDVYPALYETEYNIYVDNRYCSVGANNNGNTSALTPISVDDDNVAVYKLTEQTLVNNMSHVRPLTSADNTSIVGIRGSRLHFTVVPNGNLLYTDSMFDKYGQELSLNINKPTRIFKTIRSSIKVVGVNTGYMLEIPILFAKLKNADSDCDC